MVRIVDGKRTAHTATTRDKALQILHRLNQPPAALPPRTLSAALREYDAHLRLERRLAPSSCEHARRTLAAFLGEDDAPITRLNTDHARRLARFDHAPAHRIRRRYTLSTRYAVLGHAFRFFDWVKSRHYVERNPFSGLRPMGLVGPAPAPLSLDQARTLAAVALQQAHRDPGALGSLLVLVMGLRSGQVLPLRVQDVDADAQRLCIRGLSSDRTVPIPEVLWPCVRGAMAGKAPAELLLGTGRTGRARPHNFLWRAIQRLCRQARVSPTCPRSLRALHRKLARTATRATKCAVPGGAVASVRVVDLLGLSPSMTAPRLDALLSILTPSQLDQLRPALQAQAIP